MYRNDGVVVLSLNLVLEKSDIFNKILFLHETFHGDFWKGITPFS